MATQAERIDALEMTGGEMQAELKSAMEQIAEVRELVSKAAPLSDFEALVEVVNAHTSTLAEGTLELLDGGAPAAAVGDPRDELLKAFRQIETIANHLNIRLPA